MFSYLVESSLVTLGTSYKVIIVRYPYKVRNVPRFKLIITKLGNQSFVRISEVEFRAIFSEIYFSIFFEVLRLKPVRLLAMNDLQPRNFYFIVSS